MLCPGKTRNPFPRSHYFSQVVQKIIHKTRSFPRLDTILVLSFADQFADSFTVSFETESSLGMGRENRCAGARVPNDIDIFRQC